MDESMQMSNKEAQKKEVRNKEADKNDVLLATGFLTEYAFLQSLFQSKTLVLMTIFWVIFFGGFGLLLFKFASA
ncbi:MAG: hypothetical protein CL600_01900 [Alteromonas sp.]|uniref:hypothetical protein n=1 Tax=Alteromonas sp. MB-3u-76 TaxID=2058133 RepID=UPI000C30EA17|nr:hypothetical protein [Alteromonas sp. MB-3u-76]AUC88388.1 hypothetical protein CW735_09510 [Alteromonas sp. MB-3u-76]MAI63626.1 hypothetical protein [Alteromonas sp.]